VSRRHDAHGTVIGRRRDARQELRTAHQMFAAMGADRLAEWAAGELRATGDRARARTPQTTLDLTPQETRVADLAAADPARRSPETGTGRRRTYAGMSYGPIGRASWPDAS
jgi:hypothetical protein